MLPLGRHKAADANNLQGQSCLASDRLKFFGVDAQPNHMHLLPMIRVAVLHQLAAAKVTDTKNELRSLDLARKITMLSLIEFLGTMNGYGIVESPDLGCQHCNGRDGAPEMDMKMTKTLPAHPVAKQKRLDQVKECIDSTR